LNELQAIKMVIEYLFWECSARLVKEQQW